MGVDPRSAVVQRWRPIVEHVLVGLAPRLPARVPADLVLAMIAHESSGDPRAVRREPDGRVSRGLMQVLEGTARELGLSDTSLLHRPDVGIAYGVRYLAAKLARYQGDVPMAVAAYNAGTPRMTTLEQFVNQPYVDAVLNGLRRLGARPGAMLATLLLLAVGAMLLRRSQ